MNDYDDEDDYQPDVNETIHYLVGLVIDHEDEDHGGEICSHMRASVVAMLAHSLGVDGELWDDARQIRQEIDVNCELNRVDPERN